MSEIFEVTIKSGETLKGWHWSAKDPVTNLTIITGMNEYAKRYEPFAEWMNAQHVNIWCLDAFGQGLNAPSEDMQERWPEGAFDKTVKAIMQAPLWCSLIWRIIPAPRAGSSCADQTAGRQG